MVKYAPLILWAVLFGLGCWLVAAVRQRRIERDSAGKAAASDKGGRALFLWWMVPLCMVWAAVLSLLAPLALAFNATDPEQSVDILGQMGGIAGCIGLGVLLVWRKTRAGLAAGAKGKS